ncbi:hypothetical protein N9P66_00990 [Salibacteraceae bacterium]|nr:hypothetical protein [Salibacteraceae bacterium]
MTKVKFDTIVKSALFGFLILAVIGCGKEEGCTDPQALNFDPDAERTDNSCVFNKPAEVTLKLPVLEFDVITAIELEERLIVTIDVDDEAGGGYGIDLSLSSINHGKYFESKRGSNERFIPRLEWDILLPEINLFEQLNDLVIKVTDVEGLETYYGREFTFKDTEEPEITVENFEVEVPSFSNASIDISAFDLGAIGRIDVEWQVRPSGENEFSAESVEVYDYTDQGYNREVELFSSEYFGGTTGSFKVIITVTDLKGNQTTIQEAGVLI